VPEEKIMERCSMLLMKLLCRMGQPGSYDEQTSDEARRMKNFIDSNYQRVLTMEDIAESIFRSKDYANKLFKRCYDITPYAYYLEVKMSNAKALLLHTSLSITQIAERLGYKNAEYFSKQFSQMVGMPATRFRSGDWEHTVE
jgi:YesN/AraC family two-component response regulator